MGRHFVIVFCDKSSLIHVKLAAPTFTATICSSSTCSVKRWLRSHLNNCLFTRSVSRRSNKEWEGNDVEQQRCLVVSTILNSKMHVKQGKNCFTSQAVLMINEGKTLWVLCLCCYLVKCFSLRWNTLAWWIFKWENIKILVFLTDYCCFLWCLLRVWNWIFHDFASS